MIDLESPDLEMRPRGRRRHGAATSPPVEPSGCYAIAIDGSIATSLLGPRAAFPCDDETFYAISADGSISTSSLGARATLLH